jgi:hypothetical protein
MASLGELVARMSLDIGQFTGALNKVEQQTADMARTVKKNFDSINESLVGMVAGVLSVHAAFEEFNKTVERASNLKEMSDAFGVAVEDMDKLSLAMSLTGTDSETLSRQLKKLGVDMTDALNPSSKQAKVFADMGVAVTDLTGKMRPLNEVYIDTIRQLSAIEDPALRAAAANFLFGKGAEAALKAAEELDPALEAAQKQLDMFGVTSKDVAKASKEFHDQMILTQDMISRLFLPIVKALLPVFEDFRKAMASNKSGSVDLATAIGGGLATAFRIFGTGAIITLGILKDFGLVIGGTAAAISTLFTVTAETKSWSKGFAAAAKVIDDMNVDIIANETASKASGLAMLGYGEATDKAADSVDKAAVKVKKLKDDLSNVSDKNPLQAEANALAKEINDVMAAAIAYQDKVAGGTGNAKLLKEFQALNDAMAEDKDLIPIAADALQYFLDKTGDGEKYMKEFNAELNKSDDALVKYRTELAKSWQTEQDNNEKLQDEIKLIGLVGVERDLEISRMARRHELAIIEEQDRISEASPEIHASNVKYTNDIYDQNEALIRAKYSAEDYHNALTELGSTMKAGLSEAIDTILTKGTAGFKDLWASFKAWAFKAIADVAAYNITVGVLGSAAAGPASAQQNMLSQMGSGALSNYAGGALVSGASTAGTYVLGTGAYMSAGAGATQASLLAAQTSAFGVEGVGMTSAALGGTGAASLMTTLAPLMAAAPYIAAAAAIAYVVYEMVAQKKGGEKIGGFATGETGVGRYYTPSTQDATMATLVDTQTKGFDAIIKSLGGTGTAHFAYGFDTDPQGTAQSRVTAGAFVGGKQVYSAVNVNAGRDDASLQAALNTEAKRSLLAALQASDLPVQVAKVLDSVLATTATSAQIDAIMATATNAKAMLDVLAAMADPMKAATDALDTANQTALEGWSKQRDALYDLANAAPNTAEGLAAVTQGTQAFYVSTVQLLAGIKQAKQQLDDMFGTTRDTIEKAALTPDQQYAREQQRAQDLFKQLGKATDPADIARIAGQINDSINSAFGMLTPEEQKAKSAEFLAGLDRVQKLADERMNKSMDAIVEQTKTDRAFLTDKLNKMVDGISAAGANFKKGSDQLVDNGVKVDVNIAVQDDRLSTEVTGGGVGNITVSSSG